MDDKWSVLYGKGADDQVDTDHDSFNTDIHTDGDHDGKGMTKAEDAQQDHQDNIGVL